VYRWRRTIVVVLLVALVALVLADVIVGLAR
jgi:predicted small secreted protein